METGLKDPQNLEGRKIVFCLSSIGGGGAERVASLLCNHWAKLGAKVMIVAIASVRTSQGYDLRDDITVVHLADQVAGNRNKLVRIFALRRIFKEFSPDAIVSFLTDVNVASLLAGAGTKYPIFVSERSFPPARLKETGRVFSTLRRWLYRFSDAVVAQTSEAESWLSDNCPSSNVVVIPNPVSYPLPGASELEADHQTLVDGRKVILSSGRLIASKRHDVLIRAFADLADKFPDSILVILGEGPERRDLEELSRQLSVADRVFLLGHMDNPGAWYSQADVFAFPSSFEGFPNAVLEAMSYKLPAICFDIAAGPRQLIQNRENGIILPDDNHVARMKSAIDELLSDADLLTKISANATAVRERYSIEHVSHQWLSLLFPKG